MPSRQAKGGRGGRDSDGGGEINSDPDMGDAMVLFKAHSRFFSQRPLPDVALNVQKKNIMPGGSCFAGELSQVGHKQVWSISRCGA